MDTFQWTKNPILEFLETWIMGLEFVEDYGEIITVLQGIKVFVNSAWVRITRQVENLVKTLKQMRRSQTIVKFLLYETLLIENLEFSRISGHCYRLLFIVEN